MARAMRSHPGARIDKLRCVVEPVFCMSPTTRPSMLRSSFGDVPTQRETARRSCRQTASAYARRLNSVVQGDGRQHAAPVASELPLGQHHSSCARLAAGRGREQIQGPEMEGQIKGAARRAPETQSARGFDAAPRGASRVPCGHRTPHDCGVCSVPLATDDAEVRWGLRHGEP
jgi:hypothetical protein